MDDLAFSNVKDLALRVRPALNTKRKELTRLGYSNITNNDIWRFLVATKWLTSKDLTLADIVDDILHVDNNKLSIYIENTTRINKSEDERNEED
jgi:hypothetical protein